MAETRQWPALLIEAGSIHVDRSGASCGTDDGAVLPVGELEGLVSAALVDFNPIAIEDLTELPLPPGGLWDPTFPPIPEPPPTPLRWRAFFSIAAERDEAHRTLATQFPGLALDALDVSDEDWAARSQESLTAVEAGRYIVAPPWAIPSDPQQRTLIVIEPSMGFGTGHHATTRLCLRALSDIELHGRSVLDLGTGSGVLAIAAALTGARHVVGVDVDQDAIDNARHNAALNRSFVPPVFEIADFREHTMRSADLVMANLTGGMLRSAAPSIRALVARSGTLVISGFDETERDDVRAALGEWSQETSASEESWVAMVLTGPV